MYLEQNIRLKVSDQMLRFHRILLIKRTCTSGVVALPRVYSLSRTRLSSIFRRRIGAVTGTSLNAGSTGYAARRPRAPGRPITVYSCHIKCFSS